MSMLFIECIAHVCIYFGIRTVLSGLYQLIASRQWSTLVTMDIALSHMRHPVSIRSMLHPNVAPSRVHRHLFGVVLLFVVRRLVLQLIRVLLRVPLDLASSLHITATRFPIPFPTTVSAYSHPSFTHHSGPVYHTYVHTFPHWFPRTLHML